MVSKLRPPGDVRSKPQTSRAGRWRKGGLAVLSNTEMPAPAGGGICSGPARDLSPWVRWTPGVPRPLGLFERRTGRMTRAKTSRGNGEPRPAAPPRHICESELWLSPRTFPGLIMRAGRSIRGRFAGVMKRDRRAVGLARAPRCTPNAGQVQAARSWRHRLASRASLVTTP